MSTFRVPSKLSPSDALRAMRNAGIYSFMSGSKVIVYETGLSTGSVYPIDDGYAIDTHSTADAEMIADLLH